MTLQLGRTLLGKKAKVSGNTGLYYWHKACGQLIHSHVSLDDLYQFFTPPHACNVDKKRIQLRISIGNAITPRRPCPLGMLM